MSRNSVPKNAIKEKAVVEDAEKEFVYRPGMGFADSFKKRPSNIFLIGLRGSGKSTVGRALAQHMGRPFVDTDDYLEEKAGRTIAQIVQSDGWEAFRTLEREVLAEIAQDEGRIVATGGGIVLADENRSIMKKRGWVFYLMGDVPLLVSRLTADPNADQRPALTDQALNEEMATLLRDRDPLYFSVADSVLQAANPVEELVEDVLATLDRVARDAARQS